jgi:hypothetical protein
MHGSSGGGHGHHSSSSSWGGGSSHHSHHHHRSNYSAGYATGYNNSSGYSYVDRSYRREGASQNCCLCCCPVFAITLYVFIVLMHAYSWTGGHVSMASGDTRSLFKLPCSNMKHCFLKEITVGAHGLDGVVVTGWDYTPPQDPNLRHSHFSVTTTVEGDAYEYYSFHLNKGGHLDCTVESGSGMYFIAFDAKYRFDAWREDSGTRNWVRRVWAHSYFLSRSMYIPAFSDSDFYLVADNDYWYSYSTGSIDCDVANVVFDLSEGYTWQCTGDAPCAVQVGEDYPGRLVYLQAPGGGDDDAAYVVTWSGTIDWAALFQTRFVPLLALLAALAGCCGLGSCWRYFCRRRSNRYEQLGDAGNGLLYPVDVSAAGVMPEVTPIVTATKI